MLTWAVAWFFVNVSKNVPVEGNVGGLFVAMGIMDTARFVILFVVLNSIYGGC